jgi:DNA polymerase V
MASDNTYFLLKTWIQGSMARLRKIFAIIDVNNFFVSCERAFNPKLWYRPVIVLSNNDGCAIARSNEAKALGIKMGTPLFQIKDIVEKHKVVALSSNYTLYGDMSNRVMRILSEIEPNTEIYSIDEAFLDLSDIPQDRLEAYALQIRARILRCLGLPVSIGISHTKTLAKVANTFAKKSESGVHIMLGTEACVKGMKATPVGDVWGIGRQYAKNLVSQGIESAFDLCIIEDGLLDSYNVVFRRTVNELRGNSCLSLEEIESKQSITTSRSFGMVVTKLSELEEAISTYAAKACQKLRLQAGVIESAYVFIQTDRHKEKLYHFGSQISLPYPTSDSALVIKHAINCVRRLYREGRQYKKAGIILLNIDKQKSNQMSFYTNIAQDNKNDALMKVMDSLNKNMGGRTVFFASEGITRSWQMRRGNVSPSYTTKWSDIPDVR